MKIGYYPGCSSEGTAWEFDSSIKAVCKGLDIELVELEDWSCCGASSAHSTNAKLSAALPARNLALADKTGLDVALSCAACFKIFRHTYHALHHNPDKKKEMEEIIDLPLELKSKPVHFLEYFYHTYGYENIKNKLKKELKGIKAVSYYGCYLVRPPEIMQFDDPENPTMMDKFMEMLGAQPIDWSAKVDCCGGSMALTRVDIVKKLSGEIVEMGKRVGANMIVTACPLCQANLDSRQPYKGKEALPVVYFSELLGIAMGLDGKIWWKRHLVNPEPVLRTLNLC